MPLPDTDGDGLADECEINVFHTDPDVVDSNGDGIADGNEDADGDGLTNAEEQAQFFGSCGDADDGVEACAAPPLVDPHDPAAVRWVRAIFGDPDGEEPV